MSVLAMKRLLIVGMRKDRKRMVEYLQRRGNLEVKTVEENKEDVSGIFKKIDLSGEYTTLRKNTDLAEAALDVLNTYAEPGKGGGMFGGREAITLSEYETRIKRIDSIIEKVYEINSLSKRIDEINLEIPKLEQQLEALRPWSGFSEALDFTGTRKTKAYVGTLPNEQTEEAIYDQLKEFAPQVDGVDVQIVSAAMEQTCVMIVCLKKDAPALEEALRRMSFARPSVSGGVPADMEKEAAARLKAYEKELEDIKKKIASFKDSRDDIKFSIDCYTMRAEKYNVYCELEQSDKVFIVEGYATAKDAAKIEEKLSADYDCIVELYDIEEDEEAPVVLKNNWFGAPVEGVVASYSMPGKTDFDPSFIVAVFYYFLFGMMLSDAAYGIIMIIGCALVLRNKSIEPGMRKMVSMFLYCGVGTTFWGIMFGSWFGDLPLIIVKTFFDPNASFSLALWVEPTAKPMAVLGIAFLIGVIHILFGLAASAYQSIKNSRPFDAVCDVLFWYLLIIGAVVYGISTPMLQSMFGLDITLSPAILSVCTWMMAAGAAGVVLFTGRDSKNWGLRLGRGLYGLYGATSYLSDVLSYSRLLALGLATGVISSVFNQMASMAAAIPVLGVVIFTFIVVAGHTLNIAINALGSYVHTNRLEYVEFFSKFYNGGGKAFKPFEGNTKYYRIVED